MLGRRAAIIGLIGGLSACGFRPMMMQTKNEDVRDDLAAVEITGLKGRLGQLLRNSLLDHMNPQSLSVPPRYILVIELNRNTNALAIQLDNTVTRYNLVLTAYIRLLDREDQAVLYGSTVRRTASYDVVKAPYSTLVAEQDAERRAADEVGVDISNQLAVHFARQAPVV